MAYGYLQGLLLIFKNYISHPSKLPLREYSQVQYPKILGIAPIKQGDHMFDEFDRQVLSKDEVVFRNGDTGDCAYLIESGRIEILVDTAAGELRLGLIEKGELFGEVALIDQHPRTATARAMERTVLIPIQRRIVENLLGKSDPILRHLLLVVLERFRSKQGSAPEPALPISHEDFSRLQQRNAVKGEATDNISLTHDITRALARNEFELYYQPICNLDDDKVAGFEALIRWHHPVHGVIPPMDFLWLAEQTGLIQELGLWTLERACRDWPQLKKQTAVAAPFVSVNLSASQLIGVSLVEDISDIMLRHAMPPAELKLELTETVVVERPELAMTILSRLVKLGSTLALDDYGTGYSSLEHLQRYPIATLKIDRGFIAPILDSVQSFEIVSSSIRLAHSLGMKVVAEGIETETVRNALLQLGCEYGQGWLFGKPGALKEAVL
ncbi:MAG: hypothetical protein B7Y56_09315 [Gallionellales bacterium 35-53-114]|nr:MAG: hypothetical protein B7Y56_09315 [Gallionellales bacterium 35-53-114]OYZ62821.1 MAG: hypothetical protein B7Y04_13170 [Gallionellales bacterium 24-53-125]OZB09896.1 MAG: hypothetical protein B7X61_05070 [Gallionellales bacterium 39-52-133]